MTRFADELVGSVGEWCSIKNEGERRAIVVAVHNDGLKATVQFEDDGNTRVVWFTDVELEGEGRI